MEQNDGFRSYLFEQLNRTLAHDKEYNLPIEVKFTIDEDLLQQIDITLNKLATHLFYFIFLKNLKVVYSTKSYFKEKVSSNVRDVTYENFEQKIRPVLEYISKRYNELHVPYGVKKFKDLLNHRVLQEWFAAQKIIEKRFNGTAEEFEERWEEATKQLCQMVDVDSVGYDRKTNEEFPQLYNNLLLSITDAVKQIMKLCFSLSFACRDNHLFFRAFAMLHVVLSHPDKLQEITTNTSFFLEQMTISLVNTQIFMDIGSKNSFDNSVSKRVKTALERIVFALTNPLLSQPYFYNLMDVQINQQDADDDADDEENEQGDNNNADGEGRDYPENDNTKTHPRLFCALFGLYQMITITYGKNFF